MASSTAAASIGASGSISFGGLASGLDTKSIIESLTSVKETQLVGPLTKKINTQKTTLSGLVPYRAALTQLKSAALALKSTNDLPYRVKKGTSSDTDTLLVNSVDSGTAISGTYNITQISTLAKGDKVLFNGVDDTDTTQFGTGTFALTYKSISTNITITDSNNTLDGIVTAINDAATGVTASIINDGGASPYRLVLSANDTGADTTITQNIASVLSLTVDAAASATADNEPTDAAFKINGVTFASSTNTVTTGITGVSFTLLDATNSVTPVTLTVKQDVEGIAKYIRNFVDAYNIAKTTVKTLTSPDENGDMGPLGSDITLTTANVSINTIMGRKFNSLTGYEYSSLSMIGITGDGSGGLTVDTTKLNTAIENHITDVKKLFQGSTLENGIAEDLYTFADNAINPLGTLTKKENLLYDSIKDLNKLTTERQKQLDLYTESLTAKYQRLEKAMTQLKSIDLAVSNFSGVYSGNNNKLF